ncbi:MAG: sugar phosphate isomerase/epimerase [Planctomycetota bacterium]
MMRIATCTGGFRNQSFDETLAILDELKFDYVEGTTDGKTHLYPYIFGEKSKEDLENLLSRYKVNLVAISGGWSDFAVRDDCLEAQYVSLRRQFELCNRLKVNILRVFASHLPARYVDAAFQQRVICNIKRIVPEAKANGITMAMENHYGITATADDMLRILDGVSSPALQANFDPANFVPMGEDPVEACKRLLPYIAHTHLKDSVNTGRGRREYEGWEYCEIGVGVINYPDLLSILVESDYQGVMCIEYENPMDIVRGVVVSRRNLRNMLSEIGRG